MSVSASYDGWGVESAHDFGGHVWTSVERPWCVDG